MNEDRFVVCDSLWVRLEPQLPGKASDSGVTARNNRLFLEAVFWRVRTGSPWRDFLLLPGQTHDMKGVAPLIKDISFDARLADKAFDAGWLLQDLNARGARAVIPPKANRTVQRAYDTEVYKWRHLVENYFAKIKEFRGIATRYDKTESSYTASWHLAAALIASR